MSDRRFDIFPTPIWVGNFDIPEVLNKAEQLSYYFRDHWDGESALVSDSWNKGEKSSKLEDFQSKGFTSFASIDLNHLYEWKQIGHAIHTACKELLSDEWNITGEYGTYGGMSIAKLWTTIYPPKCFVPEHIHSNNLISGVFYIKAPKNCGDIVFHDPNWVAKSMCSNGESTFPVKGGTKAPWTPVAGDLLLFPSWLPHYTEPNESDEDRIIVSFNLKFESLPMPSL